MYISFIGQWDVFPGYAFHTSEEISTTITDWFDCREEAENISNDIMCFQWNWSTSKCSFYSKCVPVMADEGVALRSSSSVYIRDTYKWEGG